MTGQLGAMSIDGTPISRADVARMEADEALHAEWQRQAARVIAASSTDVDDCRQLLDMLGLSTQIVQDARTAAARRNPSGKAVKTATAKTASVKTASKPARKPARRTAA